ncbi:hypothetical protein M9H77_30969 [Catharanthus roseus]|uniref:Uncharacterized protein n=1 Tax=Catharanthus roseus TaxID=4058 RepID=A0ACC0A014_CATRO|nr:hypothetical protein M9H77_30969 [Catharanthus roseus]
MTKPLLILTSFLNFFPICLCSIIDEIGINYGQVANNLPSPYQSVQILKNMKVGFKTMIRFILVGNEILTMVGFINLLKQQALITSKLELLWQWTYWNQHFHLQTNSYFFLDVYPYFSWSTNPINTAALDFAFNIKLAIAETGWPNAGDIDQTGANIHMCCTYNRKLVQKMRAKPPIGTPAQPGVTIPTFIFSLYDENQKQGPGTERHWGLLQPSGWPNYELDFTGEKSDLEYGMLPEPLNDEPYKGKIWCVVATGVNEMELSPALDFACNQGEGICDELAPGKTCHKQISVTTHASYAFSSYWAKFRNQGATCYFNGLATQTTIDPSYGSCKFPSVSI